MPSAEPWSSAGFVPAPKHNGLVVALSAAGIVFILLGFLALALPESQEGFLVWQIDPAHAIHSMDLAGSFALGLGLVLTWLGGKLWNRQLMA